MKLFSLKLVFSDILYDPILNTCIDFVSTLLSRALLRWICIQGKKCEALHCSHCFWPSNGKKENADKYDIYIIYYGTYLIQHLPKKPKRYFPAGGKLFQCLLYFLYFGFFMYINIRTNNMSQYDCFHPIEWKPFMPCIVCSYFNIFIP